MAEIILQRLEKFQNIVPMIRNFYLAKAAQHCLGKLLKDASFQDDLFETKGLGVKTVETFMSRSHFVRSLRGLLIISEVIIMLKWEAFYEAQNQKDFITTTS